MQNQQPQSGQSQNQQGLPVQGGYVNLNIGGNLSHSGGHSQNSQSGNNNLHSENTKHL
jgi:hypothetical protein